jgi:hypothetical protein
MKSILYLRQLSTGRQARSASERLVAVARHSASIGQEINNPLETGMNLV